jgi:putative FmdB family regulatory protein
MPLYEYRCDACGHQFEVIQKFSDAPVSVCRKCGAGPVQKLLSSAAIQFKGTGWYVTDYARKDSAKPDAGGGSAPTTDSASSSSTTKESGSADSKSTGSTPASTPSKTD